MFYHTLIGAKFGGKAKFDKIMAIETDLIKVKHSLALHFNGTESGMLPVVLIKKWPT